MMLTADNGTSPRVWGDYLGDCSGLAVLRYIPTRVGRLPSCTYGSFQRPVHPHACGAIFAKASDFPCNVGTSPRVWGDSLDTLRCPAHVRYIPTRVGRFNPNEDGWVQVPVHPHACGAIPDSLLAGQDASGTSPRVWGDCSALAL